MPDTAQMIAESWPLVFEDPGPDDSSLADLDDVALGIEWLAGTAAEMSLALPA